MGETRQSVLEAIITLTIQKGRPPLIGEIAAMVGKNKTSVHRHLETLRKNGIVDWKEGCPGTIHIVKEVRHESR